MQQVLRRSSRIACTTEHDSEAVNRSQWQVHRRPCEHAWKPVSNTQMYARSRL